MGMVRLSRPRQAWCLLLSQLAGWPNQSMPLLVDCYCLFDRSAANGDRLRVANAKPLP